MATRASTASCLACGGDGHTGITCPATADKLGPAMACSHCGHVNQHFSAACPLFIKCSRCRQRGHNTVQCQNVSVPAGGPNDPCDICGDLGHAEYECHQLSRTFSIKGRTIKKVPKSAIIISCYNCGSSEHWGDDCPALPYHLRRQYKFQNSVWSASWAKNFIQDDSPPKPDANNDTEEESTDNTSRSRLAYQMSLFDDMRD